MRHKLDITNKVCPFCLLIVKKKLASLEINDILHVKLDHPPAALETIPYSMKKMGYPFDLTEIRPGLWEITITKT